MKILELWRKFEAFVERESLISIIVVGIFKIIFLIVMGTLIFWGGKLYNRWENESAREKVFLKLINAGIYDEKIVGMKVFELYSFVNLVKDKDAKGGIPEVPEYAIIQADGKQIVSLWRAMPKFFSDVEFGVHEIRCVQARVRKKNTDMSFDKFEDKFLVMYTNSVPEESDEAFKARLGILDENEKNREERVRGLKNEHIKSHSALFSGNCIDTFRGWVSREPE